MRTGVTPHANAMPCITLTKVMLPQSASKGKPCGILSVLGYYTPLLTMFDHGVEERFLKPENRALVLARESPADLLQALEDWRPTHVEKWLDRETR